MPEYEFSKINPEYFIVSEVIPDRERAYWNLGVLIKRNGEFVFLSHNPRGEKASEDVMKAALVQGIISNAHPFPKR